MMMHIAVTCDTFSPQNEKEETLTTNVWIEIVSLYSRDRGKAFTS